MGMLMLMFSIGMIAGPTAGTYLFQKNEIMLWSACGVVGLLSAGLALVRPRHLKM